MSLKARALYDGPQRVGGPRPQVILASKCATRSCGEIYLLFVCSTIISWGERLKAQEEKPLYHKQLFGLCTSTRSAVQRRFLLPPRVTMEERTEKRNTQRPRKGSTIEQNRVEELEHKVRAAHFKESDEPDLQDSSFQPSDPEQEKSDRISGEKSITVGKPTALSRVLEVERIDLLRLADINVLEQTFSAQIFVILSFPNGAKDPHLTVDSDEFPFDEKGNATFRPSAKWFASQLDFNNAKHFRVLDSIVQQDRRDLKIKVRYEGIFFEPMELAHFPFDAQHLTVSLVMNCRSAGMTPVVLQPKKGAAAFKTDADCFHLHQTWRLGAELHCRYYLAGNDEQRLFPSVEIGVIVGRRSGFFVYNMIMPTLLFVPTAMLQYCILLDGEQAVEGRAAISLTILLTGAAYKFAVAGLIPPVSYLTIIDKYQLFNSLLILLMCFEGCIMCVMTRPQYLGPEESAKVDWVFLISSIAVWGLAIVWLLFTAQHARRLTWPKGGWLKVPYRTTHRNPEAIGHGRSGWIHRRL
jgi:hypothetical protein